MTYEPEPICWCGHKRGVHEHYRDGGRPTDCGSCGLLGDTACLMFTPRSRPPFNEAQRRAGEVADRQMMRTFLALAPFARPAAQDPGGLPIPTPRPEPPVASSQVRVRHVDLSELSPQQRARVLRAAAAPVGRRSR